MNKVFLIGKVVDYEKVGDDIGMFLVKEETRQFYIFYEKQLFPDLDDFNILKKKVGIIGTLENIKVRLEEKQLTRRLTAIRLEDIEVINDF